MLRLTAFAGALLVATVFVCDAATASAAPATFTTIALENETAPGITNASFLRAFPSVPVINESGNVLFKAVVRSTDASATLRDVLYFWNGSDLVPVAQEGQGVNSAAGGDLFGGLHGYSFNDTNQIAFRATLTGPDGAIDPAADEAIFAQFGSGLQLIAREGSAVPGVSGNRVVDTFNSLDPVIGNTGLVAAFAAQRESTDPPGLPIDNTSIIAADSAGAFVVAQGDSPAPGATDSANYFNFAQPFVNESGSLAFLATLKTGSGPPVGGVNDAAIFGPTDSGLGIVARNGDTAPATDDGPKILAAVNFPTVNANDSVAFTANLLNPDGTFEAGTVRAIIGPGGSGLSVLARAGNSAPGAADGSVYDFLFRDTLVLNNADEVGFRATLRASDGTINTLNDDALFGPTMSGLSLIARENDLAPGVLDGAVFDRFFGLAINDGGDMVFTAQLRTGSGGIVNNGNDLAMYYYDRSLEELVLLVREGELIDVNNDPLIEDLREITGISRNGLPFSSGNGVSSFLNNAGQAAIFLDFSGSSGIFLVDTTSTAIPEPASVMALALFGAGATAFRRRRYCSS